MTNGRIRPILAAAGVFAATACAGASTAVVADFSRGTVPEGWTVDGGEYRSPVYSNAVDGVELRYAGAPGGSAVLYASSGQHETQVAAFNTSSSSAAFEFPETTDFRSFRISTGNGLALSSFVACVSSSALCAPDGVAVSNNTTGTSFDASWRPVAGAEGYRVYVWTNSVAGASAGAAVWSETFANAPSTASTSAKFRKEHTDSGESEWVGDKAYICAVAGAVRIGTTTSRGALVSPPLPPLGSSQLTFRITAWRQTTGEGWDMPLGIVSGGETNIFGCIRLGDKPATYHLPLPDLNAGDGIAVFSPTNKASARAIVDDVAVVSGYSPGAAEPLYIVDGQDVGEATHCPFAGLPSVPVFFAVEAYGRRGALSERSAAELVDLSNPDKVAVLNACPISSVVVGAYTQDFDSLAEVTAATGDREWLNGTTLKYWQAYKDGEAVKSFKYNGGAGSVGGLYALAAVQSLPVRALGAYSSQSDEFSFGMAFTNDTGEAMVLFSVEYLAQQWGFKNDTDQTLSLSAKVSDRLDWISSSSYGWTELVSSQSAVYGDGMAHDTPVSEPVSVRPDPGVVIDAGQVLMLKWTVHSLKSGKSGMMAIDDVSVEFVRESSLRSGFAIRIAGGSRP